MQDDNATLSDRTFIVLDNAGFPSCNVPNRLDSIEASLEIKFPAFVLVSLHCFLLNRTLEKTEYELISRS